MNKKQIVYIPTKSPKEGENCVLNYPDMDIYLKPTEGYLFTSDELKRFLEDYTERIIENAEIGIKKLLFDDPKEGDDAYMDYPVIDNESIQNQLDKILKELGL